MTNKNLTIGLVIAMIIAVGGYFFPQIQASLGASGTRFPNGISADSTSPSAGQVRGTTLTTTGASTLGGTVTVTTSNTATSTLIVGCIQTYATSTATAIRISATTTAAGGSMLYSVFGTCPI